MLKGRGFSLLELLIALALSTLLALAFFSLVTRFQKWTSNLHLLLERDENLRLAPLLLSRYLKPAGNNRWELSWSGLSGQGEGLEIRSDMDGSEGFPDRRLESPFESVALRSQDNQLQLKSGQGTFQPLLKNISALDEVRLTPPTVSLRLTGVADWKLTDADSKIPEPVALCFFIWNYRPNLFAEVP
ncbi:MAG: prepilin-type N-terminal cleavage/methylation domain-containing protein [Acidobacteriota bacterium]